MDKYNEALERARKLYKDAVTLQLEQDIKDYEYIFPELRESEDGRTRKIIIDFIKNIEEENESTLIFGGIETSQMIAWLEKQAEQKPIKWSNEDSSMQLTLMRDIEQVSFISQEGKDERIVWLNSLDERFVPKGEKHTEWNAEDERLCSSCINHIEEELERIRNDKYGHSEIISDLKESCRERICWLESLKRRMGE